MNKKQKFKNILLYIKNHYYVKIKETQGKLRLGIPSNDFICLFTCLFIFSTWLMNEHTKRWRIPNF